MIITQVACLSLQGLHVHRARVVHRLRVVVRPAVMSGVVVGIAVIRHWEVAGGRAIFRERRSSSSCRCRLIGSSLMRSNSSMRGRHRGVMHMGLKSWVSLVMRSILRVRAISWMWAVSRVRAIRRVWAVCWVRSWSKLWMRSSRSIHIGISIPGWMGMLSNVVTCTSMRHVRVVVMYEMVLFCVHIAKLVHVVLMILVDRRMGSSVLSFETSLALFVLVIEQRLNVDILLRHFMDRVRLFSDFLSCFVLLDVPVFSMLMIGVVHIMLLLVVTMARMLMVRSSLRHTVIQTMLFTISCLEPTSELREVKRLALLLLLKFSNGVCVGGSPSRVLLVNLTLLDILRLRLTWEAAVRVLIRVLSVMTLHLLLWEFLMMKSWSKFVLGNTLLPRHVVHLFMMDDLRQWLLVDGLLERQLVMEVLASLLGHDVVVIDGLGGLTLMRHYWHTEGDTVRGDDTRRVERGPLPLDVLLGRLVETLATVMQRH